MFAKMIDGSEELPRNVSLVVILMTFRQRKRTLRYKIFQDSLATFQVLMSQVL